MKKTIKEKLEKLKKFRNNIDRDNINELEVLIDSIKKELPEIYRNKLKALNIYEYYEETDNDFELPF